MDQILPRLYVGNDDAYKRVANNTGWSWLRCCKNGPGSHRDILKYEGLAAPKDKNYYAVRRGNLMALNMIDIDDPAYFSDEMIDSGLKFIHERWKAGDKVLVACNAGHSRGPSTMLMYLRTVGEMPHNFVRSEKVFRTLYRQYDPGQGLRQYARSHWSQLEGMNA